MAGAMAASYYDGLVRFGLQALEANILPDFLLRRATRFLLSTRLRLGYKPSAEEQLQDLTSFIQGLKQMPIAILPDSANSQHYEVPTEFYKLVLGKRLKYSSSLFTTNTCTLDEAEDAMLSLYCERAQLEDGQTILDLGCGWGSLSLYLAEKYPKSQITSVSNSNTQKEFIEEECRIRGLPNVKVITCDINNFDVNTTFDRILSIEMFEHMKNYQKLLHKVASWMRPDGLLFIHIFVHKVFAYHFEDAGQDDWMARSFFSGGTMPADSLLLYFQDHVSIVNHWRVNGTHYARTSGEWLKNMDSNIKTIRAIFAKVYGDDQSTKWVAYWRTFFIAVTELFQYNNGEEWMVSHYLFKKSSLA